MAIEYVLETIDPASAGRTLSYFAERLNATVTDDAFARREGLHIMTAVVPGDEIETTEFLLGHRDVVSTTFRLLNNAAPDVERRNLIDVVAAAVTFLEGTSAQRGILTHEGERILLQRLDDEPVVFDTAWREYALDADPAALDEIQRGRRQDTLLQPALSEEDLETLRRRQEPS